MKIVQKNTLDQYDKAFVYACWNEVYPEHFCFEDYVQFELYIHQLKEPRHFIIYNNLDNPVGWLCTFEREKQRWFVMLVDDRYKHKNYGSQLLKAAKSIYDELIGWVVVDTASNCKNGSLYRCPVNFYKKNHFITIPNTREMIKGVLLEKMLWNRDIDLKITMN